MVYTLLLEKSLSTALGRSIVGGGGWEDVSLTRYKAEVQEEFYQYISCQARAHQLCHCLCHLEKPCGLEPCLLVVSVASIVLARETVATVI